MFAFLMEKIKENRKRMSDEIETKIQEFFKDKQENARKLEASITK